MKEVNLSCLSSLSKSFKKQIKLKKIYTKLPNNYIGPFDKKKIIECYLNKEQKSQEDISLSQFIQKLSRTNKQIEKERYDYLKRLKYFNGENEESIKLKKIKIMNNISLNKQLDNLLDLRKYRLKYEKKRKEIEQKNNINIDNNYKHIAKLKINKSKNIGLKSPDINKSNIINKIINKIKIKSNINSSTIPSINNSHYKSVSINFSFNNKIKNIKENKETNKDINLSIKKENNIDKNEEFMKQCISYEKKWNVPKCLSFSKIIGRNSGKLFKRTKFIDFKDYNPNYDYVFPNTNKSIVYYKSNSINFNKYKKISTRRTLFNYINSHFSFDDSYNIININNLRKEKIKINKIERLKNKYGQLYEYLKYKNKLTLSM